MKSLEDSLAQFGVRNTPVRKLVYDAIARAETACSLAELEATLETVDKSSISRNLHLFLEAGIIHQIQDDSGVAKYALSQDADGDALENHAHFVCLRCEKTFCLDELTIELSELALPKGFVAENFSLLLKGICPECSRKLRKRD